MIPVGVLRDSVLRSEEACWHCLFLAVPDLWGAAQRMLYKKNGTKLAGQESTKQDGGEKGLECALRLVSVSVKHTHTQSQTRCGVFFFSLLISFLFRFSLWFWTRKVKVSMKGGFVTLKKDAPESRPGMDRIK